MNFALTKEEVIRLESWKKAIKEIYGEYGDFQYRFRPNGIGVEVTVWSYRANTEIDLTDVSKW